MSLAFQKEFVEHVNRSGTGLVFTWDINEHYYLRGAYGRAITGSLEVVLETLYGKENMCVRLRNLRARAVKLCNLSRIKMSERLCADIQPATLQDFVADMGDLVVALIHEFDPHIDDLIKGTFEPEVVKNKAGVQGLVASVISMEQALAAVEGAVIFDRALAVKGELDAVDVLVEMEAAYQALQDKCAVLTAKYGVKIHNFEAPRDRPAYSLFRWNDIVVAYFKKYWDVLRLGFELVSMHVKNHEKVALPSMPDLPSDLTPQRAVSLARFVRNHLGVPGSAGREGRSFPVDPLSDIVEKRLDALDQPQQMVPGPDGKPVLYGFWDALNPFVAPGTSEKVDILAKWVQDTSYKGGKDLAYAIKVLETKVGIHHVPKAEPAHLPVFPLFDLHPYVSNEELDGKIVNLEQWRFTVDRALGSVVQRMNEERNRNNGLVTLVRQLQEQISQMGPSGNGDVDALRVRLNNLYQVFERHVGSYRELVQQVESMKAQVGLDSVVARVVACENALTSLAQTYVTQVAFAALQREMQAVKTAIAAVQVPENLVETLAQMQSQIGQCAKTQDFGKIYETLGAHGARIVTLEGSAGGDLKKRIEGLERRPFLSEEDIATMRAADRAYEQNYPFFHTVATAINQLKKAQDPAWNEISFAQNWEAENPIMGSEFAAERWAHIEALCVTAYDRIVWKKFLAEKQQGVTSPCMQQWHDALVARASRAAAELRVMPEAEGDHWNGAQNNCLWSEELAAAAEEDTWFDSQSECSWFEESDDDDWDEWAPMTIGQNVGDDQPTDVGPVVAGSSEGAPGCVSEENHPGAVLATDGVVNQAWRGSVAMVAVRQGCVPRSYSALLGYNIGKRRMWLTHAECWWLLQRGAGSDVLRLMHPSPDYSHANDQHLAKYVRAGRPGLTVGQNDTDVVTKPEMGGIVEAVDRLRVKEFARDVEVYKTQQLDFVENSETVGVLHPNQKVIASGKSALDIVATSGNIVAARKMSDTMQGNGPFSMMLGPIGMLQGGLEMHIKMNLSPTCGITLVVGYAESGLATTSYIDLPIALSYPHILWNPAMEDTIFFKFHPLSACAGWHPAYLRHHPGCVFVAVASTWMPAPKSRMAFTWRLSYVEEVGRPLEQIELARPTGLHYKSIVAGASFKQNGAQNAIAVTFSAANPSGGSGIIYTLWESILAMHQWWRGDVVFEVVKASSPLVAGTFGLALVQGQKLEKVNPSYLQSLPHVEFTLGMVEPRKEVVFPAHLLGFMAPSERMELHYRSDRQHLLVYIWMLDGPTGSEAAVEYNILVTVTQIRNLEVLGHNCGYPMHGGRFGASKNPVFPPVGDVFPLLPHEQDVARYQMPADVPYFSTDTLFGSNGQNFERWFQCLAWQPAATNAYGSGKGNLVVMDAFGFYLYKVGKDPHAGIVFSPLVRVLKASCWLKGTLTYKVVWACKEGVAYGAFSDYIRISVFNDEVRSLRTHHFVAGTRCGEHVFDLPVVGPCGGFYPQSYHMEGKKPSFQIVLEVVGNQLAYYDVYVKVSDDFVVAGAGTCVRSGTIPPNKYHYPMGF